MMADIACRFFFTGRQVVFPRNCGSDDWTLVDLESDPVTERMEKAPRSLTVSLRLVTLLFEEGLDRFVPC